MTTLTPIAALPRPVACGNRVAGHSVCRRGTGTMVALAWLLLACALGGCRPTSELTDLGAAKGKRYEHHGLGFAVTVPAGWSHTELGGTLVVRLEGPLVDERLRPVAHVWVRDEWETADLDAAADELFRLMEVEAAVPGAGPVLDKAAGPATRKPVSSEAVSVSGLTGRRIVRTVTTRTSPLREETLVVARGKRVWALVISVPGSADASTQAAVDELRRSFEVR